MTWDRNDLMGAILRNLIHMPHERLFPDFLKTCPELDLPFAGARGWLIQGKAQQVVFMEFSKTIDVQEHSHNEQWEFVIAGRVELLIGGVTTEHKTGDNFYIPAGVPHAATVHAGYKAMIVFNSPDRYKAKD
jgi:quercetin dioxygenase-like cupin family protein